jgi:uracil-DNA glycosylase family 4
MPVRLPLATVAQNLAACTACELRKTAKAPVMGRGPENAKIVIVGEAPGTEEDAAGRPFVGAAGRLLSDLLLRAELPEDKVFITNAVACWPPAKPGEQGRNGKPSPSSVRTCNAHLTAQLMAIGPRVIVALGTYAAASLLQTSPGKMKLGHVLSIPLSIADPWTFTPRPEATVEGAELLIGYHPSYLERLGYWAHPDEPAPAATIATLIAARKRAGL